MTGKRSEILIVAVSTQYYIIIRTFNIFLHYFCCVYFLDMTLPLKHSQLHSSPVLYSSSVFLYKNFSLECNMSQTVSIFSIIISDSLWLLGTDDDKY